MKRTLAFALVLIAGLLAGCAETVAPGTPGPVALTPGPVATEIGPPGASLAPGLTPSPAADTLTPVAATSASTPGPAPARTRPPVTVEPVRTVTVASTEPEGKLVDLGDYDLYIECAGSGGPTVLLEYGLDTTVAEWSALIGQVAGFARVCAYDRAGIGRSQPAPAGVRDSEMMADDLYRLTVRAGLTPPFVLVGHSFGGLNALLFSHRHPDVVSGLVLIDSLHPDHWRRWQETLPTPMASGNPALPRPRIVPEAPGEERVDLARSFEQARLALPRDDVPLVVLTAGQLRELAGLSDDLARQLHEAHLELHQELARLSSNSVHVVATGSGHVVQRDQTHLVATAIHQVVIAARNEVSDLPPCDLIYPPLNAECRRIIRQ